MRKETILTDSMKPTTDDSSNVLDSRRSVTQNCNQRPTDEVYDDEQGIYKRGGVMIIEDDANPGLTGFTDASNVGNNNNLTT